MVESITKNHSMNPKFDVLNGKTPRLAETTSENPFSPLGRDFELNEFYSEFEMCEGPLGEGYFCIWSLDDVLEFNSASYGSFPKGIVFFGSDCGGSQFGVEITGAHPRFVSAPNIGDANDVRILGNWDDLVSSVSTLSYI